MSSLFVLALAPLPTAGKQQGGPKSKSSGKRHDQSPQL